MRVMAYLLHAAMLKAIAAALLAPSRRGHIPLKIDLGPTAQPPSKALTALDGLPHGPQQQPRQCRFCGRESGS
jgi:hypothetical protein